MATLVTGGAGYIGSHTAVSLHESGRDLVIVDNFSNSSAGAVAALRALTSPDLVVVEGDLTDPAVVEAIFAEHDIDEVVHFAAFKAVGESVDIPVDYYRNNLFSTINLADACLRHGVTRFVFSSSCTVYGEPEEIPVTEDSPTGATSPYGWTKFMSEQILRDATMKGGQPSGLEVVLLRYFNPVGAHASGTIGEDPNGIPNNLVPFVMQVAVGRRDKLAIFGGDYPTRDGTCIRDYIHVMDLAEGHLAALDLLGGGLAAQGHDACLAINLGTGVGSSVLDVVASAERAVGATIAHEIVDRRPGDVTAIYADPAFATKVLGWSTSRDLDEMMADHWRWQSQNPNGFAS